MKREQILKIIKQLQKNTGLSMVECLKALKKSDYNLDKVARMLHKRGLASATQNFCDTVTCSQGRIMFVQLKNKVGLLKLGCESDFVALGDEFALVCKTVKIRIEEKNLISLAAVREENYENETLKNFLLLSSARFKEKIALLNYVVIDVTPAKLTTHYIHNNQIGVIVVAEAVGDGDQKVQIELLKKIAMHICSTNPKYCTKDDIPQVRFDEIKKVILRNIRVEMPEKAEQVYQKILTGRVQKSLQKFTLVLQPAVFDTNKTIGDLLAQNKLRICNFRRLSIKN